MFFSSFPESEGLCTVTSYWGLMAVIGPPGGSGLTRYHIFGVQNSRRVSASARERGHADRLT